jgi:hypothetical protein
MKARKTMTVILNIIKKIKNDYFIIKNNHNKTNAS